MEFWHFSSSNEISILHLVIFSNINVYNIYNERINGTVFSRYVTFPGNVWIQILC